MSEFSENLKKARKQKGMTQAEIADLIGVAKSTYSLYEYVLLFRPDRDIIAIASFHIF